MKKEILKRGFTRALAAFFMVLAVLFVGKTAARADGKQVTSGEWIYELTDSGLSIVRYSGTEEIVEIPEQIDGYKVAAIQKQAFYNNYTMKSVTIPVGVTAIGAEAFRGCIALNTIYFNAKNCTFPNIWIYSDASGVGVFSGAGSSASSLTVYFGDKVTKIPDQMFFTASTAEYGMKGYDYAHITNIQISSSVKEIGENAFRNCDDLEELLLGENVKFIGATAFADCDSLEKITLADELQTIGQSAFISCDNLKEIVWANGLETIEKSAFEDCKSLKKADIPNPVTTIGTGAFRGCTALTEIVLPKSLNYLKGEAFKGTIKLGKVTVNSVNLTVADVWIYDDERGAGVFSGAGSSAISMSVTFGEGVTNVPANLFYTASIGEYGLRGQDYAHVTSLAFSSTVTSIGEKAFYNCDDLEELILGSGISKISAHAFRDCDALTRIVMDDELHTLDEYTFFSCDNLSSLEWGSGLDGIGASAFEECTSLTEVEIPNPTRTLGTGAFRGCSSITRLTLPESLNLLGGEAFLGTIRLETVNINAVNCTVSAVWIYDSNRGAGAFSGAGTGNSNLHIIFGENVTTVPANLFFTASIDEYGMKGYEYAHIAAVTFEAPVTFIGENAFRNTPDLKNVTYSGSAADWEACTIEAGNEDLKNAQIVFLAPTVMPTPTDEPTPTPTDEPTPTPTDEPTPTPIADPTPTPVEEKIDISGLEITVDESTCVYNGAEIRPAISILDGERLLIEGWDYTADFSNNVDAGTATVQLEGLNDYTGTVTKEFTIRPRSLTDEDCEIKLVKTSFVYNGKAKKATVEVSYNGGLLKNGSDYKLTYKNTTNVGTASVAVTGLGNFSDKVIKKYKITQRNISACSIQLMKTTFVYNGKHKMAALDVLDGKTLLVEGKDFARDYENCVEVGKATVTVRGLGNYKGSVKKTYSIVPAGTSISKIVAKRGGFAIKWKKQTTAMTAYQIQYATNSSFKNAKAGAVSKSKTTATITGKKSNATFYVRIRTYKTVNGEKYYSAWSATKKVRTT